MRIALNKLSLFSEKIIILLSALILILFSIFCFCGKAFMGMNENEVSIWEKNSVYFMVVLIICILTLLFFCRILESIHSEKLFLIFSVGYVIFGLYLIFNVDAVIRADTKSVFEIAKEFNTGNYLSLEKGGYLFIYPHQLGLLTYERILQHFSENVSFFYLFQLFLVLLNNCLVWKTTELIEGSNSITSKWVILFSFLFFPELFYILFIYGQIPGLCCIIFALYFFTKYETEGGRKNLCFLVLFFSCACILRNNYMIGAIAICIILLLKSLKHCRFHILVYAVLLLLCITCSSKALKLYYQNVSGLEINDGTPKILWTVMGLQGDDLSIMNVGWYNGYNLQTYTENDFDSEAAYQQGKQEFLTRIEYMRKNMNFTLKFMINKIKSTWCDSLFQSIWSGPLEDQGQYTHTKLLKSIYGGKRAYRYLAFLANIIVFMIYSFGALYLVYVFFHGNHLQSRELFACLFFIGIFLFHLFWETKSQYVWPSVILLIPLSAKGVVLAYGKLQGTKINCARM